MVDSADKPEGKPSAILAELDLAALSDLVDGQLRNCRVVAVETLIAMGFPYAVAVPPEDLEFASRNPNPEKVRCPKCRWEPTGDADWTCTAPKGAWLHQCMTRWNTFATHGVCPGCGHQWLKTACPTCHKWSDHEAWYVFAKH